MDLSPGRSERGRRLAADIDVGNNGNGGNNICGVQGERCPCGERCEGEVQSIVVGACLRSSDRATAALRAPVDIRNYRCIALYILGSHRSHV
jgi:hypothetical protein